MNMWISRASDGYSHLNSTKPEKLEHLWTSFFTDGEDYHLDYKLFPEVTFENSPQQVEIKLIENKESSNE